VTDGACPGTVSADVNKRKEHIAHNKQTEKQIIVKYAHLSAKDVTPF